MQDEQYIIDALAIGDWPNDQREPVVAEATMRIGSAIVSDLSEEQYDEYKAIVDDNQAVITGWLEQTVPDYKGNAAFKENEASYESDPETNSPTKLFASLAWVQINFPDIRTRIEKTLEEYKREISAG